MLQDNIDHLCNQAEALKKAIADRIVELPDNPKIKRLSKNAFVISSAHLEDNWTPEFHDWKHQYEYIAAMLTRMDFRQVASFLQGIVKTGSYRDTTTNRTWKFAKPVRQYLETLLTN